MIWNSITNNTIQSMGIFPKYYCWNVDWSSTCSDLIIFKNHWWWERGLILFWFLNNDCEYGRKSSECKTWIVFYNRTASSDKIKTEFYIYTGWDTLAPLTSVLNKCRLCFGKGDLSLRTSCLQTMKQISLTKTCFTLLQRQRGQGIQPLVYDSLLSLR